MRMKVLSGRCWFERGREEIGKCAFNTSPIRREEKRRRKPLFNRRNNKATKGKEKNGLVLLLLSFQKEQLTARHAWLLRTETYSKRGRIKKSKRSRLGRRKLRIPRCRLRLGCRRWRWRRWWWRSRWRRRWWWWRLRWGRVEAGTHRYVCVYVNKRRVEQPSSRKSVCWWSNCGYELFLKR